EGFDLPRGATMLAEGDAFPVQAFGYGSAAFALQFHMDVTHAMMCRWTTRGHSRMSMPGAQPRAAHFEGRLMHDPACRAWLDSFLDRWLGVQTHGSRQPACDQRRGGSRVSIR